jgi:hypothetical protein
VASRSDMELFAGPSVFNQAYEAYADLGEAILDAASLAAGLPSWIDSVRGDYSLSVLQDRVDDALTMPWPSPTMAELRAENGHPEGIHAPGLRGWSMALAPRSSTDNEVDTGVKLVAIKPVGKNRGVRVPLGITIPRYLFSEIQLRPDKLSVHVGEAELPGTNSFEGGKGQRLLMVAFRFTHLIATGAIEAPQTDTHRISGARQLLGRLPIKGILSS